MLRTTFVITAAAAWITPLQAQVDPATIGLGQVLRAQNEGYADRSRGKVARSRPSAARIAVICTKDLPMFRQQYGSDHPDVRVVEKRCRRAGY